MEKTVKSYSTPELDRLIALTQKGQREAREEIFLFLHERFLALAKHRLSEDDAQEVVQETLIMVDHHFSELTGAEDLMTFTGEVMRNKIGNFFRKRDRRRRYRVEWDRIPEPVYYMDGDLDAAELDRLIWKAIDRLGEQSPLCRDLFLGLYEGLTIVELSHLLQFSRRRVDVWLTRCRRRLREILADDYGLRL
ncbi:MAG: sigma-70 family RNA polymerase sigma factor [Acidobacteria bacterium]|nr:sigma-70 family RNA polymerase sigma factor [Acidobacteriota bacterium]